MTREKYPGAKFISANAILIIKGYFFESSEILKRFESF